MESSEEDGWFLIAACNVGLVVGCGLLWEVAAQRGWIDRDMLPPLSSVLQMLWTMLQRPSFLNDLYVSLVEVAAAFAIVVPVGLISGFFIGERPGLLRVVNPTLQLLIATPKAILLPLFILAFGIGFGERVLFAAMVGLFITVLYGVTAVQSVSQGLVTASRSFGATPMQLYRHIYLPAMMPLIVSGVRIALIFTIFGILLSEMYASSNGFGRLIFNWGESFKMRELMAGVIIVVVFSVGVNELLAGLEKRFMRRQGT